MQYEEFNWSCDGHTLSVGMDSSGAGSRVLLLPALSSISTRREMYPLLDELARSHTAITVDWPGFGDLPKPRIDWRPEIYLQFLQHLFTRVIQGPLSVISAGHAAGYILKYLAMNNTAVEKLVLLSPTWRGPLPTMMGGDRSVFSRLAKAFDPPVLGALLYGLNVNRYVVGMMARGHVYADPAWLTEPRMLNKLEITKSRGARYTSARFVTGRLDPFKSREEMLEHTSAIHNIPIMNMYSQSAPRKSRAEMAALSKLPTIHEQCMAQGKLSFYEEFPGETAEAICRFIAFDAGAQIANSQSL